MMRRLHSALMVHGFDGLLRIDPWAIRSDPSNPCPIDNLR